MEMDLAGAAVSLIICSALILIKFLDKVWLTPIRVQAMMKSQGIRGPSYSFPHGNAKEITEMRSQSMAKPMDDISHNIFPRCLPHVYTWTKAYGMNFLHWHGSQARLYVTEPELIKEILMNREGLYRRVDLEWPAKKLLGEALASNEGEKWAKVWKVANHTFHSESLKSMVPEMCSSVEMVLERWKHRVGEEIDMFNEFKLLTTEVISRTAFGSSYVEGVHIFEMMAKLREIIIRNLNKVRFPGVSVLLKSQDEIEADKLEKQIKNSILDVAKKRERVKNNGELEDFGSDYLGKLMKLTHETDPSKRITIEQMIDETRLVYGAGYITTTSLLSWCMFLLAIHTDWQQKAREEVFQICGTEKPDSDGIAKLNTMNMFIKECLRLYPPVLWLARKVEKGVKLGNLHIPVKMDIYLSIIALHHSPQIWGEDVHIFRPERFAEGVAKATNNNAAAFFPFGVGPRTCIGLNFTTNEAKIALSMILQQFEWEKK